MIGPEIIDERVEENMRKALKAVKDGSFAELWVNEARTGMGTFNKLMKDLQEQEIEKVGKKIRTMSGLSE